MRDLPALLDDDTTDLDSQVHLSHPRGRASLPKSPTHKSRIRQAMPRPQPQLKSNLTGGKAQRGSSSTTQHARNRESFHDTSDAPFQGSLPDGSDRASSPDVASFLAATPRPRRQSETSTGSRSQSQSRRRTHKSLPGSCRTSAVGRLSVFSLPDQPARQGSASLTSRSLLAYADNADDELWNDDSLLEDYGIVIGSGDGDFVPDEDDATGDSDSSLDLHTPLPCVLLNSPYFSHSELTLLQ
jgi:large subunit ribosomal protein LP1